MNKIVMKWHLVESLVVYVFTPHLKAHDHAKLNLRFSMARPLNEFHEL